MENRTDHSPLGKKKSSTKILLVLSSVFFSFFLLIAMGTMFLPWKDYLPRMVTKMLQEQGFPRVHLQILELDTHHLVVAEGGLYDDQGKTFIQWERISLDYSWSQIRNGFVDKIHLTGLKIQSSWDQEGRISLGQKYHFKIPLPVSPPRLPNTKREKRDGPSSASAVPSSTSSVSWQKNWQDLPFANLIVERAHLLIKAPQGELSLPLQGSLHLDQDQLKGQLEVNLTTSGLFPLEKVQSDSLTQRNISMNGGRADSSLSFSLQAGKGEILFHQLNFIIDNGRFSSFPAAANRKPLLHLELFQSKALLEDPLVFRWEERVDDPGKIHWQGTLNPFTFQIKGVVEDIEFHLQNSHNSLRAKGCADLSTTFFSSENELTWQIKQGLIKRLKIASSLDLINLPWEVQGQMKSSADQGKISISELRILSPQLLSFRQAGKETLQIRNSKKKNENVILTSAEDLQFSWKREGNGLVNWSHHIQLKNLSYNPIYLAFAKKPLSINLGPQKLQWNGTGKWFLQGAAPPYYQANVDFQGSSLDLSGVPLQIKEMSLKGKMKWKEGHLRANGDYRIGSLSHLGQPPSIVPMKVQGQWDLKDQHLQSKAQLSDLAEKMKIYLQASYRLPSEKGSLHFQLETLNFKSGILMPDQLFPGLIGVLGRTTGTVKAHGFFLLPQGQKGQADSSVIFDVRDFNTEWGEVKLQGVNTELTLNGLPTLKTPPGQIIRIAGLETSLPFTNGKIVFELNEKEQLKIDNLEWYLFGGRLWASDLFFDLKEIAKKGLDQVKLTLKAQELPVNDLLKVVLKDGLKATGVLEGQIPMVIEKGRINIDHGHLKASGPGMISYRPAGNPAQSINNEYTRLLMNYLENYHYKKMRMDIQGGDESGLKLQMLFEGANPNVYQGKPMQLNVQLFGDLMYLLRGSLKAYQIPEKIQRQILQDRLERPSATKKNSK